jgi:hypothetical protein
MREETDRSAMKDAGERLQGLVRRQQRRWRRVAGVQTLATLLALPLCYLWVVFLLDNLLHFSTPARLLAGLGFLIVTGGLLLAAWARGQQRRLTDDRVALAIEKHAPEHLGNRLINSIQLSRSAHADALPLAKAVQEENYERLRGVRLPDPAPLRPALVWTGLAAVTILCGLFFYSFYRTQFTSAAARIFLPFANVAPVYRTVLDVKPGNIEIAAGSDVRLDITISGRIPDSLVLLTRAGEQHTSRNLAAPAGTRSAAHTFRDVRQTVSYSVRGGDYQTPFYTIRVPGTAGPRLITVVYDYPDYTALPDREERDATGDLAAVYGTRARLKFQLDEDVASAALLVWHGGDPSDPDTAQRRSLENDGNGAFRGTLTLTNQTAYRLVAADRLDAAAEPYTIRVADDQPPALEVTGLKPDMVLAPDAVLNVSISVRDDYGLAEVGLFRRRETAGAAEAGRAMEWKAVRHWPQPDRATRFSSEIDLPAASLEAAEGDTLELALRARDADPRKKEDWAEKTYRLTIGDEASRLQIIYERMLRSEAALRDAVAGQERLLRETTAWQNRIAAQPKQEELQKAMAELASRQAALRDATADIARNMIEEAATVKLSLGLLADTEMVRCVRILEEIPAQDAAQATRRAAGDARLTQDRTLEGLRKVLSDFTTFREGWELNHMIPFVEMLAKRQRALAGVSAARATGETPGQPPARTVRRQEKLFELAGLAQTALAGMGTRAELVGPLLAEAFSAAARDFDEKGVKIGMQAASEDVRAGRWTSAEAHQARAADALAGIHTALLKARAEAAREAIREIRELGASDVEDQGAIKQLKPGSLENLIEADGQKMDVGQIIGVRKTAQERRKFENERQDPTRSDHKFEEWMRKLLASGTPKEPDFSVMKLADKPGSETSYPGSSDLPGNRMEAKIMEGVYEDLVGDLLEEADELRDDFETYNMAMSGLSTEPGEVGKQGGDLSSASAASATGNMKPPTQNVTGASRAGRQGARSFGLLAGQETIDRRGRDEAQEGQQTAPDQQGSVKEVGSEDRQEDSSTGIGGKQVEGNEEGTFSLKDAGEWSDDMVERLREPGRTDKMVERKGNPIAADVAAMMRDMQNRQEQVIERIKRLRKELKTLYLPTDHLDDIMDRLKENLEKLEESPSPDLFRRQLETLDNLKSAVVVFNRPASDFEPSLPRPQDIRGEILDGREPEPLPEYDEIVKDYYRELAE